MTRTLRAFFLGRLLREKLLLVVFAAIGALWWLSAFSTRLRAFNTQQRRTTAALKEQQQWLDHRDKIEADAKKAADKLDRARTLNGTALVAAVTNIAREAGLRQTTSGSLTNQSDGRFSVHSFDFTINNAAWEALEKFFGLLQQRSPYIGLDRFQIVSGANPTQLNLTVRVSSVEVSL